MSALVVTAIAVFVGTAILCLWFGSAFVLQRANDPLARLTKFQQGRGGEVEKVVLLKLNAEEDETAWLDGIWKCLGIRSQRFERWLKQTGLDFTSRRTALVAVCSGSAATVTAALLRLPVSTYAFAGLFGAALAFVPLYWRNKRRLTLFAQQLPDALELMSSALRSGNTLQTAMQVIVEEMMAPISTEFETVSEAVKLGIPVEQALQEMADRVPSEDLQFFVTAVVMQRRSGGDLSEILEKISWLVRERFYLQGQVLALTGEGRMSGWVLMALPLILFVIIYALNPDYVMLLFTEPLGQRMLAVAMIMQVLGAVAIRRIVNIRI